MAGIERMAALIGLALLPTGAGGSLRVLLPALRRRCPGITFVRHRPLMNVSVDEPAIKRFVADTRADILFLATGAPQSEIAAHRCLGWRCARANCWSS